MPIVSINCTPTTCFEWMVCFIKYENDRFDMSFQTENKHTLITEIIFSYIRNAHTQIVDVKMTVILTIQWLP